MNPQEITPQDLPHDFGRFRLDELVGEGGMARVFKAELQGPAGFRRDVALKVVRAHRELDPVWIDAFINEAKVGALLRHTNIVSTYDLGEIEGCLYIALEYVEGLTLHSLIQRTGPLNPKALLALGMDLCAGLQHLEELRVGGENVGLVHRDLKPKNVLIRWDGICKVADFGIALARGITDKVELTNAGTLLYMSPEQAAAKPIDSRSDQFALAALLYRAATGQHLFARVTMPAVIAAINSADVLLKRPDIRGRIEDKLPGLGDVLARALRVDPNERYPSFHALHGALKDLNRKNPSTAPSLVDLVRTALGIAHTETEEQAPTTLGTGPRTNLGEEAASFVGRKSELKTLGEMHASGTRLITVTGFGGIGKTRLARRYAAAHLPDYIEEGGVWIVDLSECVDLAGILTSVSAALGLMIPVSEATDDLVAKVGQALALRKKTLLVLDNVEQVIGPARKAVEVWLNHASTLEMVVTSRERLNLASERVVFVAPLTHTEARHLLVRRARAMGFEGAIDARLDGVIPQLEGIPLAIELTAARLGALGLDWLVDDLRKTGPLEAASEATSSRQGALRATINWSWQLLTDWEQAALAQCAAFRGPFSIQAAEAVLDLSKHPDAPWVGFIIESLADKSLVRMVERDDGTFQFELAGLIRTFATEKLEQMAAGGGPNAVGTRHARFFGLRGTPEQLDALRRHGGAQLRRRMAQDATEIHGAHAFSLTMDEPGLTAQLTLAALAVADNVGTGLSAIGRLAETALALKLTPDTRLELLIAYGRALRTRGRLTAARRTTEEAVEEATTRSRERPLGEALCVLARIETQEGEPTKALQHCHDGLEVSRRAGDRLTTAELYAQSAVLSRSLGDLQAADTFFGCAGQMFFELGDVLGQAKVLSGKGTVCFEGGHPGEARNFYQQALALFQSLGDRRWEGIAAQNIASTHQEQGQSELAQRAYDQAQSCLQDVGDRGSIGHLLSNQARIYEQRGELKLARRNYERAMMIHAQMGATGFEAIELGNIGVVDLTEGKFADADDRLTRAIGILGGGRAPLDEGVFLGFLGLLKAIQGKRSNALAAFTKGEHRIRNVGHGLELAKFQCRKGAAMLRLGDKEQAWKLLEQAGDHARNTAIGPHSELALMLRELKKKLR